jgi:hypothetical protein
VCVSSDSNRMGDSVLWQSLDDELVNLVDNFSNLLRAAQISDEDAEHTLHNKEKKAPGDLLEIWAEKLVYSGYTALHILSQLKKGVLLGDVNALVNNVRSVRDQFAHSESAANALRSVMKQEMQDLLCKLETSYYSSDHRGRLITSGHVHELSQLCLLSQECGDAEHRKATGQK